MVTVESGSLEVKSTAIKTLKWGERQKNVKESFSFSSQFISQIMYLGRPPVVGLMATIVETITEM